VTRAFVAVVPPPEVLDAVEAAVAPLRSLEPEARWTRPEQRHVTLQFLGDHVDVDAVVDALGDLALTTGRVRLGGGGAFPSVRRGRILWLGFAVGGPWLAQAAAAIGALLAPLGHPPDDRPFHPHLTLARWKRPTDLAVLVDALGERPVGGEWAVGEIAVFESRTHAEGAEHLLRGRLPLATPGPAEGN